MEDKSFNIKFEKIAAENLKDILKIIGKDKLEKIIQNNKKDIKNEPLINGFRLGHMELKVLIDIFYSQIKKKNQKLLKEIIKTITQRIFVEMEKEILALHRDKNFKDNFYKIINKSSFSENISLYLEFSDEKYDGNIEEGYEEYKQKLKEKKLSLSLEEERKKVKDKDKEIKEIERKYKNQVLKLEKGIKSLKEIQEETEKDLDLLKNQKESLKLESNKIKEENKELNKKVSKVKINTDIKNLEEERSRLEKKLKELEDEKKHFKEEIEELKKDEDNIIEELETEENRKNDLLKKEKDLERENNKLKESIDTLNLEMGNFLDKFNSVFKNSNKNSKDDSLDEILVYQVEENYNVQLSSEELADEKIKKRNLLEEFRYEFSENLENIGLKYENVWLAMYIYSVLSNKNNLLLIGYSGISVANALSNTICSKNADIINIPIGFNNSKELINIVKNCKSKVVVINNVLDIISENVYLPLLKVDMDKIVIFTMESEENLEMISKYLYNYLVPIELDSLIEPVVKKEFNKTNIEIPLIYLDIGAHETKKVLKGLKEIKALSNILKIKYAKIFNLLNVMFDNESNQTFEYFLKFSSKILLGDKDE